MYALQWWLFSNTSDVRTSRQNRHVDMVCMLGLELISGSGPSSNGNLTPRLPARWWVCRKTQRGSAFLSMILQKGRRRWRCTWRSAMVVPSCQVARTGHRLCTCGEGTGWRARRESDMWKTVGSRTCRHVVRIGVGATPFRSGNQWVLDRPPARRHAEPEVVHWSTSFRTDMARGMHSSDNGTGLRASGGRRDV